MITYTWDIFRLDCAPSENGLTDVVKVIHWILQAQDENGVSSSINNSYPLPSPSPEEFSDYSTLTRETVLGWLESNLDVGYLQSRLANEIATQYNPPIVPLPLPWVKVEEPVLEVIEEPVAVEEPVLEVIEEPVAVEEPVLEVIEEPAPTEPTLEEMVADGYNPDARDGDGDGLVQDGTQWERPIDTQL
jgi:hypothetical protein